MTIDKAIEILIRWQEGKVQRSFDDVNKATSLGIEALKRLDDHRHGKTLPFERWLPGETEE